MGKKYGILVICAAILVLCFVGTASARIWYVDEDGGADFTRIQDAINNATAGDTVIVRDGTYDENLVVDKRLTIRSENGAFYTIVRAASSNDDNYRVFEVNSDYVNISGFTVEGEPNGIGLYLYNSNNCGISNNTCSNNSEGIRFDSSSRNTIIDNKVIYNELSGITFVEGTYDFGRVGSDYNIIKGNIVTSNNGDGICICDSSSNIVKENNVKHNEIGISIHAYRICYHYPCSYSSMDNEIYLNNFINNTNNFFSESPLNSWNSIKHITYHYNSINFTNYLGNYWSDYTGSDTDGDGIGDTPYQIDGDRDRYPLMELCEKYFALPMPGEWRGSAEFGEFVFIVNNSSTGISKISYNFSNWTCGATTISGGVSIGPTHWPITSGQFTIETDVGGWPGRVPMTIRGKFDETGTHASGNWEAVSYEVTCSGAWDADYNSNEKSNT